MIETTRSKPMFSTDTLAVLLQTSRGALTKQLQRRDFPEALSQEGRTRLWSFEQIEDLLGDDVKTSLPAHLLLDSSASHHVQYLGPTLSTESVTFWFLVDGEYAVGYSHDTWGQEQVDGLFVQSHCHHPRVRADHQTTLYSVERTPQGPRICVEVRDPSFDRLGDMLGWAPHIGELEALLNTTLPVWPPGTEDPELMMQWHPGALPVHREIRSRGSALLRQARDTGRLKLTSAADEGILDLAAGADYFVLQDYLRGHSDRDAVVDISAADRFEALESQTERSEPGVPMEASQSIVDMLHLWAPDDAVARELVHDLAPEIEFAPTEERPMVCDDAIRDTVLGYVLSRFIGIPRQLLLWGVDAEFSVQGNHRHIEAVYARRPGGRWWAVKIPKHW